MHGTGRRVERLAIDLQDAPLPSLADQEVGLAIAATIGGAQPQSAIREEQHAGAVKRLSNPNLRLRSEAKVVPCDRYGGGHGLVVDSLATRDLKQFLAPIRI